MSFAINPLQTVTVQDPRIRINNKREFAILEGGERSTWKPVISSSFSNSSVQITAPPPSPGILVDRKVLFRLPVRITITGDSNDPGQTILQTGFDSFRAFPISKIINTLQCTINNNSSSVNMSDIISPLLRYQTGQDLLNYEYSMTPTMQDTYQRYVDGDGTMRNPLAGYFDNSSSLGRGGFPMNIIQNDQNTAIIEAELTEFLYLSPFLFGKHDCAGMIGVQTMDFNITFISNLARLWSHSSGSGATINSVDVDLRNVTLGQPTMLFNYITPKVLQPIPERGVVYPLTKSTYKRITTGVKSVLPVSVCV